ncbi:FYN-binding protein 1 isoform X2 [Xiphophorus couchianus]|uniref:FYN-binding protein 1 isoform X2 n=1 Tax=Xiphophorus couchianus TaxID=32473 RepID=UPI001016D40A|nr:FYN-binding protein 1-like isoform X2 [Xiphophorus couchianus]
MEDSVDVKALRARFNSQARASDTSSRDSGSPKSPRPGFGRPENDKISAAIPLRPYQGLARPPKEESPPPVAASLHRPSNRASVQSGDATNKVKQTGEMLQKMMLTHQRAPGPSLSPARSPVLGPSPATTPLLLRHQARQKSSGEVTPLRRPLPPEGPLPLKPKRPPNVNLEPFRKTRRAGGGDQRRYSTDVRTPVPAVMSPPKPPQRSSKPNRLPRQIASVDFEDEQETYDDIGSFEKNESCSDNNSHGMDADDDDDDDDDVYEFIDEEQVSANHSIPEKNNQKDAKRQQEQEMKEQLERQKKLAELKRNFQLQGEVNVLHTARVRYDWQAEGKLDLSVRQGDSVEIIRVENNPRSKWLARSLSGQYGYISNSCVDIDYEAVKKFRISPLRKMDTFDLPPPPPDPPMMPNMESDSRNSFLEDDDEYDDVQPLPEDFPPPPPEIRINPKEEKELRKKFKYNGPLRVLHSMMVDPSCVIKKLGGKDLQVTQGEVVDVIEETNSKKFLCRNRLGKYGYVSKSILLAMEGDIYDDVDYPDDVYDNDNLNMDH